MKVGEYDNSIFYRLACGCGSTDHDTFIELEKDDGDVWMNMYSKLEYPSWYRSIFRRLKDSLKIIFKGNVDIESSLYFKNEEHILSFIESLKEGMNYVKGMQGMFNIEKVSNNAFLPEKIHKSDAGYDLRTPYDFSLNPNETKLIDFGFRIELLPGYAAFIMNRSGIVLNYGVSMKLAVGLIDSSFRGNIVAPFLNTTNDNIYFKRGDRISQMVIMKVPFTSIKEGSVNINTDRGKNGLGSSGLK